MSKAEKENDELGYGNPWQLLSSREIYRNPWFRVREDQVIRPDGHPGTYSVVEPRIATGVVALDSQERVWLVGQYRYPINIYSWEIIEGGAEVGESAQMAAQRELREEAGIFAKEWSPLGPTFYSSNCFTTEQAQVFLAQDLEFVGAEPDGTEILKTKVIDLSEALEMVDRGEITDAISIIALQRAWKFLKEDRRW